MHDYVMPTIQHDAVIFEPTPEDRVAAEHVAELITPASMGSLAGTTATAGPDPDGTVFEFVVQLATRAIADLAAGRMIAYTSSPEAGLSPADAATLLGVSRQFVDRLIADGKLTHRYKPGSKHRDHRNQQPQSATRTQPKRCPPSHRRARRWRHRVVKSSMPISPSTAPDSFSWRVAVC